MLFELHDAIAHQERARDIVSSRGDQLDPNTRSLINAACAQVQASSSKARLYASFVVLDDPHMASSANCRNTLASDMKASCLSDTLTGSLVPWNFEVCLELLTLTFGLDFSPSGATPQWQSCPN
jgi:hypothetical protein